MDKKTKFWLIIAGLVVAIFATFGGLRYVAYQIGRDNTAQSELKTSKFSVHDLQDKLEKVREKLLKANERSNEAVRISEEEKKQEDEAKKQEEKLKKSLESTGVNRTVLDLYRTVS